MMTPGPVHPITIEPAGRRWRAAFEGHVIADSDEALVLTEANYAPVVYFPREAVSLEYMSRTDRSTHCPYKGDAGYFTLLMDGRFAENAAWTYEKPFPAMAAISERIAFYPNKVEVYAVEDAAVNRQPRQAPGPATTDVDEVVKHTDSGGGASQQEHWPPNVEGPDGGVR